MKKAGIIFFIILILLTGFIRVYALLQPVKNQGGSPEGIWIRQGNTSHVIAERLKEKNLIRSSTLFRLIVSITGKDQQLKAGYYEIKPSNSAWEIISILTDGRIATFKFTIPEGYTVKEIAKKLSKNTFHSEEELISAAKAKYDRSYLPPLSKEIKYPIEGFLYPNTYILPRESEPKQIYNIFLDQFEKVWFKKLNNEVKQNSDYSINDIITIASLIEEEAKLDNENKLISAVIHNRLNRKMYLQIDATIQYSLPKRKERILYKDLKIESHYNTYLNYGLPVGPICNPGDEAIRAALNPADVDYLFYFALNDGSHKFTRSYKEHLESQQELKKENKEED